MEIKKIGRAIKQNKDKILTLRLAPDELEELKRMKAELKFGSTRELVFYCLEVVKNLKDWETSDNRFYLGNDGIIHTEVKFEFTK